MTDAAPRVPSAPDGWPDGWHVEVVHGPASEFHARPLPPPDRCVLWWFEVDRPALVLGTGQPQAHVDLAACRAGGIEVVRRHSGGGAVLLEPGAVAWFDLVIPRSHPQWVDDIGRAAWWVGELVATALGLGPEAVHRGPMVRSPWSAQVCFAGLGPGEVTTSLGSGHAAKLAGLSQRRTRDQARFQVAVYRSWAPGRLVSLLSPPAPTVADLAPLVATADLRLSPLLGALRSVVG